MSFAAVAGAAIGVVGSVAASRSASNASRDASRSAEQAATQDRALARETRMANEAMFAQYLGDEEMARAYLDALQYGVGSYNVGGQSPGTTRNMTLEEVRAQNPRLVRAWESGDKSVYGRPYTDFIQYVAAHPDGVTTQTVQGATGTPIQVTRAQVMTEIDRTPLAEFARTHFGAREGLAEETYAGGDALADGERNDLRGVGDENYGAATDLAGRARTGRRGVAQENLDSRLGKEADSYAAWLPMNAKAEQDAINLNFSRGGVTGLVGQMHRAVGQTTQDAAMERNLRRLQGIQAAYDPYYDDVTNAENIHWNDQGAALDERGSTYLGAEELRGRRRQNNFAAYSGARAANYDQFAGDQLNSYASYTGFLNDRVGRGGQARNNIAGFASDYASAATAANNRASQAAQAAHARQGQINQQLYGDLADVAGGTYASIFNRNKGSNKSGGGGVITSAGSGFGHVGKGG
jgi:hypothetical protein